jgi:ribosomal protein L7Ae-like RNA K-turn-binding protein
MVVERLRAAAARRFLELLGRGARQRAVAVGEVPAQRAVEAGQSRLLVVAADAAEIAVRPWVRGEVGRGSAVAWGTRSALGEVLGTGPISVIAVLDADLAVALSPLPALAGLAASSRTTPGAAFSSEVG